MRKPGDIGKIRRIVSGLIRNREIFINSEKIKTGDKPIFLNVGCGSKLKDFFINLDYNWRPGIDICWDLEKGNIPLKNESVDGIYTEHLLEHLQFDTCRKILKEFHRILKKEGLVRIIVPDAGLYFSLYVQRLNNKDVQIPYEENFITPAMRINALYRNHGHKVIYDYETFEKILHEAGFDTVIREKFGKGKDPYLILDSEERAFESLYIEAIKD